MLFVEYLHILFKICIDSYANRMAEWEKNKKNWIKYTNRNEVEGVKLRKKTLTIKKQVLC